MKKREYNVSRIIGILILTMFSVSLVPILYASFFAHPIADDYSYSFAIHNTIQNGGNIFDVLGTAFSKVAETYFNWQGTFSAVFLFALQPCVFSDNLYFLTTFIMVGSLAFGTFFLIETLFTKYLKLKIWYSVIVSFSMLFVMLQFMPHKSHGLYWFNGSCYYTFFYSVSLVFYSFLIRLNITHSKRNRLIITIFLAFLAVIIGGSNYSTALMTTVITFFVIIYSFSKKSKLKLIYIIVFSILLIAFIISIVAPGNRIRAEESQGSSPIKALLMSFFDSALFIGLKTELPQIVFFVFVSPILFIAAQNCKWTFKYPLVVIALLYCIYSCQFTPTEYALSKSGYGRQMNIYYYAYCLFVTLSLFYFYGWIIKKHGNIFNIGNLFKFGKKYAIIICLFLMILFVRGSFSCGIKELTSVDTAINIANGTVQQYDKEYDEINHQLDSGKKDLVIDDFKIIPDFYSKLDIETNPNFWVNDAMAKYFQCETVRLKPD